MKKKILLMFALLLTVTFTLSGCTLFTVDQARYLNQSVATITYEDGTREEITKRELITAFSNYGSTLMDSYGYTAEQALDYTVEAVINRRVLLVEAKKTITLTNADLNDIYRETYEALVSNLADYEAEAIDEAHLDIVGEFEGSEEEETTYTPYDTQARIVKTSDGYKIELISTTSPSDPNEALIAAEGEEIASINKAIGDRIEAAQNKALAGEAKRRYIADLKLSEQGQGLSTVDSEVFDREIERIYDNALDNKYIELYQEATRQDDYSTISLNQVLRRLTSNMLSSFAEYSIDTEAYSTDMLESFDSVNYVMNEDYFFVAHILIEFDKAQSAEVTSLETDLENGIITQKTYNDALALLAEQIKVQVGDTEMYITDFRDLINSELTGKGDEAKAEIFKDYLYTYNEDPGIMNAEYLYVIGKDDSQMVESFTNASRELWDNGNGQFGSLSGVVPSEYGAHIIFYAGPVTNVFTIDDPENFTLVTTDQAALDEIVAKLDTKLNVLNNKTLFDKVFEDLVSDNYSIFENMNMNVLKKDLIIERHSSAYSDMLG